MPFVSTALSSIFAVCNAGVGLVGPLEVQSLDSMKQILEVNLFGTIQTIQAFLPGMKVRGKGHILVTGSTGGLHGEMSKSRITACQQRSTRAVLVMLMLAAMPEIAKISHLYTSCSHRAAF